MSPTQIHIRFVGPTVTATSLELRLCIDPLAISLRRHYIAIGVAHTHLQCSTLPITFGDLKSLLSGAPDLSRIWVYALHAPTFELDSWSAHNP